MSTATESQKAGIAYVFGVRDRWGLYVMTQIGSDPQVHLGHKWASPARSWVTDEYGVVRQDRSYVPTAEEAKVYAEARAAEHERQLVQDAYDEQRDELYDAMLAWVKATDPTVTDEVWKAIGPDGRARWTEWYLDEVAS